MSSSPPKWADRFLEWFCHPDLLEDLQGDLYELYEEKIESGRPRQARWLFVWWVLRSLRWEVIHKTRLQNLGTMAQSNFKIAARVLWRDKFNTFLNISGLAIGLTCFLLMGAYFKQEMSYDQFHSQKDRIYRAWVKEDYGGDKVFFNRVTPLIFEQVLEDNFPEVDKAIQLVSNSYLVGQTPNRINENVYIISPELFEVFDFTISQGNTTTPLPDQSSLILSESYAEKYFGSANPIGQALRIQIGEEEREFTVSAVFENLPKASSLQFNMAISTANNERIFSEGARKAWFNVVAETYILLKEGTAIENVAAKVPDVVMSYLGNEVAPGEYQIGFQPLTDIHLNPDVPAGIAPVGNPRYAYILGLIGLIVLITAGVNYATLSIGQSLRRRKEVGIRKVMGAMKSTLIGQYLAESWLVTLLALLISLGLAHAILPVFNTLTQADIDLSFQLWHLPFYLGLVLVVGFLAGIYPALILSGLNITHILSGSKAPKRAFYIRKSMVVFQFVITVFLITSTLIMRKQLNYMNSKDLGYQYEAAVSVPLYPDPSSQRLTEFINSAMANGEVLREQLKKHPEISDIGMGSHVFGSSGWGQLSYTDDEQNFRQFRLLVVDPYYFRTFGIQMVEGRSFEPNSTLDNKESVIINQAAANYFGLEDPVGKKLPGSDFGQHRIIGVTDNFNYASLHTAVEPLVITMNPMPIFEGVSDYGFADSPIPKLVFQYTGQQLSRVNELLREEWEQIFPGEELNIAFVEDNIQAQYENEQRMNRIVSFATILSIIVAGLGLLGMTVLMINSRVREIGIRKVMGASEFSIFKLLAGSFAPQLLIGIALSIPLTFWLMRDWLDNFAYRISIGVDVFLLGSLLSVIIALGVISFRVLRAARINPVESIRKD
jgi:putative ABC transport system permease protein